MKKIFRKVAFLLALTVLMTLCGCGVTVDEVMNVVAPTEAPELTPEQLGIGQYEDEVVIEPLTKTTEVGVLPITQRQHGELQMRQICVSARKLPLESRRVVWCFTFSVGADHEQRAANIVQ